jgi:phosphate:Na+ symporter
VAGDRLKRWLARATTNRVAGLATGTAATAVLDSSSVAIVLVIALVDAGLLDAARALAVVLGANVGTTVSSQLLALDLERWSPVLLAAGLATRLAGRTDRARDAGTAVLGLGLVLFGLLQLSAAVGPLEESERFAAWMQKLERPVLGVLAGAATTLVIQSSSATLGIAIALASQGLLSLPAGVAVMLGAEIGTCSDTLVATLGRSRAAVRVACFHLAFNVLSVCVGLALIEPLTALARALGGDAARQLANAHVAFNLAGALAALPFLGVAARALERLVPDRPAAPAFARQPDAARA